VVIVSRTAVARRGPRSSISRACLHRRAVVPCEAEKPEKLDLVSCKALTNARRQDLLWSLYSETISGN
jgi:hypothetical protein